MKKILIWGIRFLIPFVVLYTIGYYIPGFSALTIRRIFFLALLITFGQWLVDKFLEQSISNLTRWLLNFLLSTSIISLATLGIEGGNVPVWGSLIASLVIALLTSLVLLQDKKRKSAL